MSRMGALLLGLVYTWALPASPVPQVALLAGNLGGPGCQDGPGSVARFNRPGALALDPAGQLFICDEDNQALRRISPDGAVSTLDCRGRLTPAWQTAVAVAADGRGNLYALCGNAVLKRGRAGDLTCLAGAVAETGAVDGPGSRARFHAPKGLAVSATGTVYVADTDNHTIRKITPGGRVSTLAGRAQARGSRDGQGSAARFDWPGALCLTQTGLLLVGDQLRRPLRMITPAGRVTTLRTVEHDPDGRIRRWSLPVCRPQSVAMDPAGNAWFVTDEGGLFQLMARGGLFSLEFHPDRRWRAVATDATGTAFLSAQADHAIYRLAPGAENPTLLAGQPPLQGSVDGPGASARFQRPGGLVVDAQGTCYITDAGTATLRMVSADGRTATLAGTPGRTGISDGQGPEAAFSWDLGAIALDARGRLFVVDGAAIRTVTPQGQVSTFIDHLDAFQPEGSDPPDPPWGCNLPWGIAVDPAGFVYASVPSGGRILKVAPDRTIEVLSGTWAASGAPVRFQSPGALALDDRGNLYVAEAGRILKRQPNGQCVALPNSFEWSPGALVADPLGHLLAVDRDHDGILAFDLEGPARVVFNALDEPSLPRDTPVRQSPYGIQGLGLAPSGELITTLGHAVVWIVPAEPLE